MCWNFCFRSYHILVLQVSELILELPRFLVDFAGCLFLGWGHVSVDTNRKMRSLNFFKFTLFILQLLLFISSHVCQSCDLELLYTYMRTRYCPLSNQIIYIQHCADYLFHRDTNNPRLDSYTLQNLLWLTLGWLLGLWSMNVYSSYFKMCQRTSLFSETNILGFNVLEILKYWRQHDNRGLIWTYGRLPMNQL